MTDSFTHIICARDYQINEHIRIYHPTIEELSLFGYESYQTALFLFLRRPYDMMVELDEIGVNYQELTDFSLFCQTAPQIPVELSCILFGKLDFTQFTLSQNNENQMLCLYDFQNNIVIDEAIYKQMAAYLRFVNFQSEKVEYDMANEQGRQFLLERMRTKRRRGKTDGLENQFSNMLSFLVNNEHFKYDYESISKLRLCQVYESYYRISHAQNSQNLSYGIYSGSIDQSKLTNKADLLNNMTDLHK